MCGQASYDKLVTMQNWYSNTDATTDTASTRTRPSHGWPM